jgi:hypothetical protein
LEILDNPGCLDLGCSDDDVRRKHSKKDDDN